MSDICVLIAAAGRGTRSGLPYPKTLYPIKGVPILLRILEKLLPYDLNPTVVVSPQGEALIRGCLCSAGVNAHVVVQPSPLGMGDAVLHFSESPAFFAAQHVLMVWGDIPHIQTETVRELVNAHLDNNNDFTFATREVDSAYTVVLRDQAGKVISVVETREVGVGELKSGERDIGLFVFRKDITMTTLREDLPGKFGKCTGEHGFLYVVEHLVKRGLRVVALPIAKAQELVSLNRLEDLELDGEGIEP